MHEVRVYRNRDEGTRWWAEDDLGFTGGADKLERLISAAIEWAESEGVLAELEFRLVPTWTLEAAWRPPVVTYEVPAPSHKGSPLLPALFDQPAPAMPYTRGAEAIRVGFAPAAA